MGGGARPEPVDPLDSILTANGAAPKAGGGAATAHDPLDDILAANSSPAPAAAPLPRATGDIDLRQTPAAPPQPRRAPPTAAPRDATSFGSGTGTPADVAGIRSIARAVQSIGGFAGDVATAATGVASNRMTDPEVLGAESRLAHGMVIDPATGLAKAMLAPGVGEPRVPATSTQVGTDKDGNLIAVDNRTGLVHVIPKGLGGPTYQPGEALSTADRARLAAPGLAMLAAPGIDAVASDVAADALGMGRMAVPDAEAGTRLFTRKLGPGPNANEVLVDQHGNLVSTSMVPSTGAGKVGGAVAGATVGAASNPDDPLAGALTGGGLALGIPAALDAARAGADKVGGMVAARDTRLLNEQAARDQAAAVAKRQQLDQLANPPVDKAAQQAAPAIRDAFEAIQEAKQSGAKIDPATRQKIAQTAIDNARARGVEPPPEAVRDLADATAELEGKRPADVADGAGHPAEQPAEPAGQGAPKQLERPKAPAAPAADDAGTRLATITRDMEDLRARGEPVPPALDAARQAAEADLERQSGTPLAERPAPQKLDAVTEAQNHLDEIDRSIARAQASGADFTHLQAARDKWHAKLLVAQGKREDGANPPKPAPVDPRANTTAISDDGIRAPSPTEPTRPQLGSAPSTNPPIGTPESTAPIGGSAEAPAKPQLGAKPAKIDTGPTKLKGGTEVLYTGGNEPQHAVVEKVGGGKVVLKLHSGATIETVGDYVKPAREIAQQAFPEGSTVDYRSRDPYHEDAPASRFTVHHFEDERGKPHVQLVDENGEPQVQLTPGRALEHRDAGSMTLAAGTRDAQTTSAPTGGVDEQSVPEATGRESRADEPAAASRGQRRLGARVPREPATGEAGDVPQPRAQRGARGARLGHGGSSGDAVRQPDEALRDRGAGDERESSGTGAAAPSARRESAGSGAGRPPLADSGSARPEGADESGERPAPAAPAAEDAHAEPHSEPHATPAGVGDHATAHDFWISPEVERQIGAGGPIGKRTANLDALKLLQRLEAEGRPATTPEEQLTLAKYVGWGALPGVFDPDHDLYTPELEQLLTPEEYAAARASTLNAHYTSIPVIKAIYETLYNQLGVTGAPRILEPSAGIGHFLGTWPDVAKWTAIELDSVTGRMARLLYPNQDVRVQGFEQAQIPDGSIDVAVGNVPFGDYKVSDPRYDKLKLSIHDYFFAKTLDLVRPGGVIAMITSRYTLDKRDATFRRYIDERAEFVGAFRLPDTAFSGNAGTSVVTDIIMLRRRGSDAPALPAQEWLTTGPIPAQIEGLAADKHNVNAYFLAHPEMVLGEWAKGKMFRGDLTVKAPKGLDIQARIDELSERLPANVYVPREPSAPGTPERAEEQYERAPDDVKEGGYVVQGGKLYQRVAMQLEPITGPSVDRLTRLTHLKTATRELFRLEAEDAAAHDIEAARARLNTLYDRFATDYGPINLEKRTVTSRVLKSGENLELVAFPNRRGFTLDPDWPLVAALERYDGATGKAEKADLLKHRMLAPRTPPAHVDNPVDALAVVLDAAGKVDVARIAQLTGQTEDEVTTALEGAIYQDPVSEEWQTADAYLSGPVRQKLAEATRKAKDDPRWQANVDALERVQPEDLPPSKIAATLGSPWLPVDDIRAFVKETLGTWVDVAKLAAIGEWKLTVPGWERGSGVATAQWGTHRADAYALIEDALNNRLHTVYDPDPEDPTKRVKNAQETLAAQDKQQQLRDAFEKWVWNDQARATRLARYYNDHFNNLRLRTYDAHVTTPSGEKRPLLTLPGLASFRRGEPFALRPHQLNAIYRALQSGNTLLAHQVGAGKTYTMAAIAMEMKRLGLAKKPLVAVPNHMLEQFRTEFQEAYPGARLLVATPEDFAKERRKAFVARAAAEDWDAIIMTHRAFEAIPMSPEFQAEYIRRELAEYEAMVREAKRAKGDTQTLVKLLEKGKKRLTDKLKKLLAESKKDDLLSFEHMGVDHLLVDELHLFKNLEFQTKMQGISVPSSERAFDLFLKTRYLDGINPGRYLTGASGTPIANSMAEMFTMQRYFAPRMLEERGIQHFDAWAQQFGRAVTALELAPDGSGYRMNTRFAKFVNVAELVQMFRTFADVIGEDVLSKAGSGVKKPPVIGGKARVITAQATPDLERYVRSLVKRSEKVKSRAVDPSVDNMLKITGDGRHAAMDMRLVSRTATFNPEGKIGLAVEHIYRMWEETTPLRGAQLVFSDIGTPKDDGAVSSRGGQAGFSVYAEIKRLLVERGVPSSEIAFIHDADNDQKKAKLFEKVRRGTVRVLLGSTEKMGAGTNVQDRLVAEHHLDAPWRPSDVEQRDGRIVRQGNLLYESKHIPGVHIFRYVTAGSFDAYMWQGLERKAQFIAAVMNGDLSVREMEDLDAGSLLNPAEVKALASGNPLVMQKAGLDNEVAKLERTRRAHLDSQFALRQEIATLPPAIENQKERLASFSADVARVKDVKGDKFTIEVGGKTYTKRADAAEALKRQADAYFEKLRRLHGGETLPDRNIGDFAGFPVVLSQQVGYTTQCDLSIDGAARYARTIEMDVTPASLMSGLEALLGHPASKAAQAQTNVDAYEQRLAGMRELAGRDFEHEARLKELRAQLETLNAELQRMGEQKPPRDEDEEDGDEPRGGGGVTLYSGLPVDAFVRSVKDWLAERKRARAAIAPAPLEEVEKRWQDAKGIVPPSILDRAKAGVAGLREMTQHFPGINPAGSPMLARVNELLLEVEHGKHYAETVASDAIAKVIAGLTPGEVDLMTRKMVLDDILKDVDAGLYDKKALPFGYPDRAAVALHLEEVEQEIGRNRKVAAAIARRQAMAKAVTTALVDADRLSPKVLADERYYHRQVLAYFNTLHATTGLGSQDARPKRKGFQRERVGGGDFNTQYVEAEFEWLAQAHRQLHQVAVLAQVKRLADVRADLEAQAKVETEAAFQKLHHIDEGALDPRTQHRQKIAMATAKLYKLALHGDLDLDISTRYADLLLDLRAAYDEYVAQPKRARGEGAKARFRFDHPDWFRFLTDVLNAGGDAASWAGTIFKHRAAIDRMMRADLGDQFVTWQTIVPAGYRTWQPVEGTQFYKALTIPEYMIDAVLSGQKALSREALKEALVAGGPKEQWVVPDGVARTLDHLGAPREEGIVERALHKATNGWKIWQLLSPMRALKFNVNNQAGDMDIADTHGGMYAYAPQAAKDLKAYLLDHDASPALEAEMQDLVRRRVLSSGFTANEIPDVTKYGPYRKLATRLGPFGAATSWYWDKARALTNYREAIMRLAAYRYFLAQGEQGIRYGVSNPAVIRALPDPKDRAAKLSRDLIGDYGNISSGGQWLRSHIMPFYSWFELNAKRYFHLFRNITEAEGPLAGATRSLGRAATQIGRKAALVTAKALLLIGAVNAWNHVVYPQLEAELGDERTHMQLILGRTPDGAVRTMRIQGALSDLLEIVNLQHPVTDLAAIEAGRKSWGDQATQTAEAPVNKALAMWEPFTKTGAELLMGRSLYPDAFSARPIRDKGEYLARNWSLDWLYRRVTDHPVRPGGIGSGALSLLTYATDPGEAAYYRVLDLKGKWLARNGKPREVSIPTEQQNALYYWKQALKWDEPEKADRWLARYYAAGGTRAGARASLKASDPLGGLTGPERHAFRRSLTPREADALAQAEVWYHESLKAPGRVSRHEVPSPPKRRLGL